MNDKYIPPTAEEKLVDLTEEIVRLIIKVDAMREELSGLLKDVSGMLREKTRKSDVATD